MTTTLSALNHYSADDSESPASSTMTFFDQYDTGLPDQFFDEMFVGSEPRAHYKALFDHLRDLTREIFEERRRAGYKKSM